MRSILAIIVNWFTIVLFFFYCGCLSLLERSQDLTDYLPTETDLYTWKLVTIKKYSHANEWKQDFLDFYDYYNIKGVVQARYEHIDDSSTFIIATVIETRSVYDAFGLFSRERLLQEQALFADERSYISKQCALAYHDTIFIKLHTNDKKFLETQKDFLNVIFQRVPIEFKVPNEVAAFAKICDIHTIVAYNEGISLIPHIKNVLVTTKVIENEKINLFFKPYSKKALSASDFKYIIQIDNSFMVFESSGATMAFKIYDDSYVFIGHYNHYIFGLYAIRDVNKGKRFMYSLFRELAQL